MGNKIIEVPMRVPMEEERLQDLLCCAFEGGSNSWYIINSFNYAEGHNKDSLGIEFEHIELPFHEGCSVTVGNSENTEAKVLDLEAIKSGVQAMAEHYPNHFADWAGENEDSVTGDVFLQCCLYGELVFA